MISVDQIKNLREKTGAGIADCREALSDSKGSMDKAVEYLKKKGIEKAVKKGERETGSGKVFTYLHSTGQIGVVMSLLCETDFVAKTDDFNNLGKEICLQIASMNPTDAKVLLAQEYIRDSKLTIDGMIKSVIGKLGENIKVDKFYRLKI